MSTFVSMLVAVNVMRAVFEMMFVCDTIIQIEHVAHHLVSIMHCMTRCVVLMFSYVSISI